MLVKYASVLASLALFGVTMATKGWKFVLIPASEGNRVKFNGCFIFFDAPEESDRMGRRLEQLDSNTFVWEGDLDVEAEQETFKLLAPWGESARSKADILYFYRDELNLAEAPEDGDGYRVVKVEYTSNDQATLKNRTPPSQDPTDWCGTCA